MKIFGKDSSPLGISAFYFEIWPLKLLGQCHKGQLGEIISKIHVLHVIVNPLTFMCHMRAYLVIWLFQNMLALWRNHLVLDKKK